ncbi:hypothetical protein [Siphonobacter sp. SORGH_AS_1065]|uniref:hypothetical protein n=1 Tax=Siphonobacter sp. SORGH_AS_1065 TaxID=3041795 RepID=UPI00278874BF|nr:hypothetical protein [Siphonobacter sp. SORGH_AS_1065]MDQ1090492.1 hypothetical protein [Siphonobacter sp. SORGH_AS_1065]
MAKNQIILILTRDLNDISFKLYDEINKHLRSSIDIFILSNTDISKYIYSSDYKRNIYIFGTCVWDDLNIQPLGEKFVPGNTHLALLKFFLDYPDYESYWLIEDDVRFSGNWSLLFNTFNNFTHFDFLSSHIRSYIQEPYWYWWETLEHDSFEIPLEIRLRSFNPIYRISNNALSYIYNIHKIGWKGHYEVLLPTMLYLGNYKILDFGGSGHFVSEGFQNRFYTSESNHYGSLSQGTMKYRPISRKIGSLKNKLYHPIKL